MRVCLDHGTRALSLVILSSDYVLSIAGPPNVVLVSLVALHLEDTDLELY